MIKGVFGIRKFFRWFKCIILDNHDDNTIPSLGSVITIDKCRYCGRTLCGHIV